MTADLDTLLALNTVVDEWGQAERKPQDLLTALLPVIGKAQSIRLWRVLGQAMLPLGDTGTPPGQAALPQDIDLNSLYARAIKAGEPLNQDARWVYAVMREDRPFILLELETHTAVEQALVQFLGDIVAAAIMRYDTHLLLMRQAVVTRRLANATTFEDIASAIGHGFLRQGQFVAINLLHYDRDGQFDGFLTIATANRHKAFSTDYLLNVKYDDIGADIQAVIDNAEPLVIPDLSNAPDVGDALKVWSAGREIKSSIVLPMRVQGRVQGLININDLQSTFNVSSDDLMLLNSIADQIAAVVLVNDLTEQSAYTRRVSDRQALVFNELSAGQDYSAMGQVIARHMLPDDKRILMINALEYDDKGYVTGWQNHVMMRQQQALTWDATLPAWQDLAAELRQTLTHNDRIVVDNLTASDDTLGQPWLDWLQAHDTQSCVFLPIVADKRPVALLMVLGEAPNLFSPSEVSALQNIAELMGALQQTTERDRQTRTSYAVVENLVKANRMITTAETYGDMSKAVTSTLANSLKGSALTLFDTPLSSGEDEHVHRLVSVTTDFDVINIASPVKLPSIATHDLRQLQAGMPITHQGERVQRYIPTQFQQETDVDHIVLFGLRSGNLLLGTLVIGDDKPIVLTDETTTSYATLADQIGLVIRSQQLLSESREMQRVASQLVQANQSIAAADDYTDIGRIVLQLLPADVIGVALILFDHPATPTNLPRSSLMRVYVSREEVVSREVMDTFAGDYAALPQIVQRLLSGEIIEMEDAREREQVSNPNVVAYFNEHDVHSFITVGLRAGRRLLGLLSLTKPVGTQINPMLFNNIRAIADQTAVTIENRDLLEQTSQALGLTHAQFEATSALYSSDTPAEMLNTLSKFFADYMTDAHIAIVNSESQAAGLAGIELHIPATVNQHVLDEMDHVIALDDYIGVDRLLSGEQIIALDIKSDPLLSEEERDVFMAQGYRAIILQPLMTANENLLGVVQFTSKTPVEVPLSQMLSLQTLIDQTAVALENRQLLQTTASSLSEIRTLYEVNRKLLNAEDVPAVAKALYEEFADDCVAVMVLVVVYDAMQSTVKDYVLQAAQTDSQRLEDPRSLFDAVQVAQLQSELEALAVQSVVVWPDTHAHVLAVPAMSVLALKDVKSSIVMVVRDDERVNRLVMLHTAQTPTLSQSDERLYSAIRDQVEIVLERQRLLADMQRAAARLGSQVRILQTINHLSNTITNTLDQQVLFDSTCEALVNVLDVDHVGVAIFQPETNSATVVSEYPDSGAVGQTISSSEPTQKRLRTERRPIVIQNVDNNPEVDGATLALLQETGIRSIMLLPLLDAQGAFIGSIGLDVYEAGREITQDMQDVALTLTAQIAVALQNIRLLENAQRQADQMEKIASFSRAIQANLEVEALLKTCITDAGEVIHSDHVSIILYDSVARQLRKVAWRDDNEPVSVMPYNGPTVTLKGTSAGRVWELKKPYVFNDFARETQPRFTWRFDVKSSVSFPIFSRGVLRGVLEVASVASHAYTDSDRVILQQLVNQIAVALENAEVYEQSQRVARSKALVNDITSKLQQQMDIDQILNVTVNELGQALGARRGRIRLSLDNLDENESDK
jgi:GAF domain-containing protein